LEATQKTQQLLLTRRDYVKTDAYIEEVARNELKWSRAGEIVVVIMATPQAPPPMPVIASTQSQPTETPLQVWLTLLFPNQ